MFSVKQKRSIADKVQQILRDTGHPELPVTEIYFTLHIVGAEPWSWAEIQNNAAVLTPSVNPWNEAQAENSKPEPKPLAQYLAEYIEHEIEIGEWAICSRRELFKQALDAYESTEQVKIRIERV